MIPVDGFSGIVAITAEEDMRMTGDKYGDGELYVDMLHNCKNIVPLETSPVDLNNDKHSCSGRMTVGNIRSK